MVQKSNDDVARALADLAGGAIPSEQESPSSGFPSESTVFNPEPAAPLFQPDVIPPAPSAKFARSPAAKLQPQPAITRITPAAPEILDPSSVVDAREPAEAVPTLMTNLPPMPTIPPPARIRSSPTSKRPTSPDRPVAPITNERGTIAAGTPIPSVNPPTDLPNDSPEQSLATDDFRIEITDDDEVIVPAPDLSQYAPSRTRFAARPKLYEQMGFRRTLIPILLTVGVELIALGAWSASDRTGILGRVGRDLDAVVIIIGAVLLGLAILNMLQIKSLMSAKQFGTGSKR